ncbi:MAG: DUF2934 domain-containing protein [Acidobacteriota bacterium]
MANAKKPTGVEPAPAAADIPAFDSERVAQRAYELYLSRGGGDGQDLEDWLIAECEVGQPASRRDGQDS